MLVMEIPENETGATRLRAAIRDQWNDLSASERAVAQYLVSAPVEQLLFASAQQLGAASSTSNATVVRALQRLGYAGLPALKRELANDFTSAVAPEVRLKRRIAHVGGTWTPSGPTSSTRPRSASTRPMRLTGPDSLKRAVAALAEAREVFAYGVAASEPGARHLALALGRIGRRARAVSETGFALADQLLALGQGDAVVIFQPGRRLMELSVLMERARSVGAKVVLVTDELGEAYADRVDAVLTAPHTPTGITAESLTGLLVADALLLALATLDEDRAVGSSHQLTALREQLLDPKRHG